MEKANILYEVALEAIQELFALTSITIDETKDYLNDLIGEIEIMLESMERDE